MEISEISGLSRDDLNQLKHSINASLEVVGKKFGLVLSVSTIHEIEGSYRSELTGGIGEDNELLEVFKQSFLKNCHALGMDEDCLGHIVSFGDSVFRVVGCKPEDPTIIVLRDDIGTMAFGRAEYVRNNLV